MLSVEEKRAITNYKNYVNKHLTSYQHLADYWVPEFDASDVFDDENLRLDALIVYINNLSVYYKHIKKYAELRQYHYTTFILDIKEEDTFHKFWREALNSIVVDSKEKLTRWEKVKNNTFDYFTEVHSITKFPDISVVNVDYEEENIDKEKKKTVSTFPQRGKPLDTFVNKPNKLISININKKELNMRRIILNRELKQQNVKALEDAINVRQEFNSNISSLYMKKFKIKDYYKLKDEKSYFYSLFSKYYFKPHHFLMGTDVEVKELFNKVIISTDNDEWTNPYFLCTDIRIINLCIIRVFTFLNLTVKINKNYDDIYKLYNYLREMFIVFTMNKNYFLKSLDNLESVGMPEKLINNTLITKVKYIFNVLLPVNEAFVGNYRLWSLYLYLEKPLENIKKLAPICVSLKHLINYIKEKFPSYLKKQHYDVKNRERFIVPKKYSLARSDIHWMSDTYHDLYDDTKKHKNNIQKMVEIIDSKIEKILILSVSEYICTDKSGNAIFF